jgi:hypothetical protein
MSLATLKKKTNAQYNNLSVQQKQFSINGTRRSQGYVGQTMLSRHFPATLMRGTVARGHGGYCGEYFTNQMVKSTGISDLNDTTIVKKSVLNNLGLYHTVYKWIWRPQPETTVKNMGYNKTNDQQSHIEKKVKNTLSCITNDVNTSSPCSVVSSSTACLKSRPFGSTIRYPRGYSVITKPISTYSSISQSAFIKALAGSCTINDEPPINPNSNQPLPGTF